MKILAVGGGSGGHVTPVVAVLREVKRLSPEAQLRFWCDKKFALQAKAIMSGFDKSMPVDTISSGKFRRYHSLPVWKQLLRFRTIVWPNIRDLFLIFAGLIQSLFKLIAWRPDVIFIKGGFVGVPVGIAAKILQIPIVIHDSDAHPGLANRIVSRFATAIATGAPLEYYSYPKDITKYIGTPVDESFMSLNRADAQLVASLKRKLGFDGDKPLTVVTGGGLGAERINEGALIALEHGLLELTDVLLITGEAQYKKVARTRPNGDGFIARAFISTGMAEVLGAADAVIARAGATTILELAALGVPTFLVPNKYLTGGHQLKNAKVYADAGAVKILDEEKFDDAGYIVDNLREVIGDKAGADEMSRKFKAFAKPNAAHDMAEIIIAAARV